GRRAPARRSLLAPGGDRTRDREVAGMTAGQHVLSEKPVAHDHHDVRRIAGLARAKGLKTKVGFTFRYSPAVRYLKDMLARGDLGTPYIYNAYEQNSQWLSPRSPCAAPSGSIAGGSRWPRSRATGRRSSTSA